MAVSTQGAYPIVPFGDPRAGIDWLGRALGARPLMVHPEDPSEPLVHAEVRVGDGIVMLSDADPARTGPFALPGPVVVYVVAEDPDALHGAAVAAGAEVVMELTDQPYGSREFAVRDPHGNVWSVGTYRPDDGAGA